MISLVEGTVDYVFNLSSSIQFVVLYDDQGQEVNSKIRKDILESIPRDILYRTVIPLIAGVGLKMVDYGGNLDSAVVEFEKIVIMFFAIDSGILVVSSSLTDWPVLFHSIKELFNRGQHNQK